MFSDPSKNIDQIELTTNLIVADLGAGTGAYTLAAARKLKGGQGKVYAVEVQRDLLTRISNEAEKEHLTNIDYIWGDIEKSGGTKIRDRTVDCVIASNVLFQTEDRNAFASEVSRILKPGGKLMLIDWSESFGGMGPVPESVVTSVRAEEIFKSTGLTKVKDFNAGAHHYGIIFAKAS